MLMIVYGLYAHKCGKPSHTTYHAPKGIRLCLICRFLTDSALTVRTLYAYVIIPLS